MLELFKEIIPKLSRLAVVIPVSSRTGAPGGASKVFLTEIETAAKELSVQIIPLAVRGPDGYEAVVGAAKKERANALFSRLPPGTPFDRRKQLMELATKSRLPVGSGQNLDTEAGGIMSYGWDRRDLYRRGGNLCGQDPERRKIRRPARRATNKDRVSS